MRIGEPSQKEIQEQEASRARMKHFAPHWHAALLRGVAKRAARRRLATGKPAPQ